MAEPIDDRAEAVPVAIRPRPAESVDERHLPPWMRLNTGETERDRTARCNHSCYICGAFIVDLVVLDAHEEGHSAGEKASALSHRPERL